MSDDKKKEFKQKFAAGSYLRNFVQTNAYTPDILQWIDENFVEKEVIRETVKKFSEEFGSIPQP